MAATSKKDYDYLFKVIELCAFIDDVHALTRLIYYFSPIFHSFIFFL